MTSPSEPPDQGNELRQDLDALAQALQSDSFSLPEGVSNETLLRYLQVPLARLEQDRQRGAAEESSAGPGGPAGRPLQQLGRFLLIREIGRGGYGVVFQAFDPDLKRHVAIKVPRPEALVTPELRRRFLREAQAAAALDHPHITPIHESGSIGEICFIVSALCRGTTLFSWQAQQPHLVSPTLAAQIVAAIADATEHAHQRGVLHRDIKPSNILVEPVAPPSASSEGVADPTALPIHPRLTDFGMAKLLEEEDDTRSGALMGTPAYMSPEQAEGRSRQVGPATDVYGLGCVLYQLLTERPPFKGETALETLEQVRTQAPVPPSRLHPRLPGDLETICLKCLDKDPASRYPTAGTLADDLRRFLAGQPIQARRPSWLRQVSLWAQRPERPRDAGLTMMVAGGAFGLWCILALIGYHFGLFQVLDPVWMHVYVGIMLLFIYSPMVWLGWKMIQRHRWACWVATIQLGTFFIINSWGSIVPGNPSGLVDDAKVTIVFNLLLAVICLFMTIINAVALWSVSLSEARARSAPANRPEPSA